MKKLFIWLTIMMIGISASAHKELEIPMKVIGEQFKIIAAGVQKKKITIDQVDAISVMQEAISEARLVFPENAKTEELKAQYSLWMTELAELSEVLESQAMIVLEQEPQDLFDFTQTLIEMNELRKEAHEVFKED